MKAIQIVHHKSKRIYGIMKYKKDEICYIIENNIKIVPVKILKYSSEFYTVKLLSKAGAIRLKEHRIFATEEEARKILGIDRVNRKLENITEYDPISGIGINYFSAIKKYNNVCVSGNIWIASGSGWKTIANLPAPVAVTRFPVGYGTAVTSGQITASGELQINLKGGTNTAYEFSVSYFSK